MKAAAEKWAQFDMGDAARQDVLGQKASASRRAFEARAMSPAKALRRALSRTADVLWELPLVTQGVQQEMLDQDGCLEVLAPGLLLLLMEGPDGVRGLVSVDREIMTGMIEIQTISKVTRMPIEDRPLTPTDAAMMAPLIDGALERFETNLEGHPDLAQLSGYRFGAMVEDARTVGLLLEATSFRAFRVTLDLDTGTRRGDMQIILPIRKLATVAQEPDSPQPGPHEQRMMLVPARIEVVLARVRMPLSRASALRPGDLIELPASALDKAELIAGKGQRLAAGRLGQMNGFRAIRLNLPGGPRRNSELDSGSDADRSSAALPDIGLLQTMNPAEADLGEGLPDLPSLDFEAEFSGGGDFDFDPASMAEESGEFTMAAMATDWDTE